MSQNTKWQLSIGGCTALLVVLMLMPQILHKASGLYQGVSVHLNSDEDVYLARVEEALTGRPELAAEAFIGHPNVRGTQVAFIEAWYGRLFSLFDVRAATLLDVMDGVVPALILLSLVAFFRLCGFSRWPALVGACVFCLVQLYNLGRPIHMRASFLLMLWSLIGILFAVRGRWWGMLLGGVLLGLLIGVYFWSFSFAWAYWGVFFAWETGEWVYSVWCKHYVRAHSRVRKALHTAWGLLWHLRPRKPSRLLQTWHLLGLTGIVGLLAGLPAIAHLFNLTQHSFYEYGAFRSGMHPGYLPESFLYSGIFLSVCVLLLVALIRGYSALRPYRPAIVMVFAACIYMHQQAVHGTVFNFVSHGIFSLLTAMLCVVLLAYAIRTRLLYIAATVACIYVAAVAYDGRYIASQWRVADSDFSRQHLASTLSVLDAMPRARILSDTETMAFIAGYTQHDVPYSLYLKNVLLSHQELAVRFCRTQLPIPPEKRNIAGRRHLIFPDATAAFGGDMRQREESVVTAACEELDLSPATSVRTFEVSHILWNKNQAPNWDISRFQLDLETVAQGDTWVLYAVK